VILFDDAGVTWELRDGAWAQLEIHGESPSGRYDGAMVYNPARKRLLLASGIGLIDEADEVWELDTKALVWSRVYVAGATSPLPRHRFALVMQPNVRSILLFGGASGTQLGRNDTWQLKYLSSTPDENCTDTTDNDDDGKVDSDDPDCDVEP
jgi:hypothetical protein